MAKFFVGQRVRLVRPVHRENRGLEGRIVRIKQARKGTICANGLPLENDCDCTVDFGIHSHGADGNYTAFWQIEPILDPGAAPSELTFTELMDRCKAGGVECV